MSWTVELTPDAARAVRKLDPPISRKIRRALAALETLEDPRARGMALTGVLRGLWRFRVGDYRIVCDLIDDRVVVLVVDVGHRSTIYND